MVRPEGKAPGGPVARITIPPGWITNVTLVSRRTYHQVGRVRYQALGNVNTHFFVGEWGKSNEVMKDLATGEDSLSLAPQDDTVILEIVFFNSQDQALSGKKAEEQNLLSSQLYLVPVTKPADAPKGIPDYITYFVFVEDTAKATQQTVKGNYDDIVATIQLVDSEEVPVSAGKAAFATASKAIGDFQFSTGIPDNLLVPGPPYVPPPSLKDLPVGIIGAGAAGLYTGMILDSLGIKYEILEATGRHGGRLFTHQFHKLPGEYQYFDAGAMRYPDVTWMKRTFDLARNRLGLGNKLIPMIMANQNTFMHFNGIRAKKSDYHANDQNGLTAADTFKVGITSTNKDGYVPEKYLVTGHKALYEQAIEPLRQYFVQDSFPDALKRLMAFDMHSVRSYMASELGYPNSVIRWLETMEWRTGMFDASLTETVIASLSFDDPRTKSEGKNVDWFAFDGGSHILADAMLEGVGIKPTYYKRVTAIAEAKSDNDESIVLTVDGRDDPRFENNFVVTKKYSNVVCTLPFSVLRGVDMDNIYLSVNQRNGLRELLYSPSIKVGIQFKTAWWEKLGIVGGQSYTDRPARSVVYPSYGPGLGGSQRSNVLIASYNGMQDSQRLGALMKGRSSAEEKMLLNLIMTDLAVIHDIPAEKLWAEYVDYFAWDWYSESSALGAFAWFGPGQFQDIYPHLTMPAGRKQRLYFAGDAVSAVHGWVAGALNSAWRCVNSMLVAHPELNPNPKEDIMKKFTDLWGESEEWDPKTLEKHTYLGRELTKRQLRTN